MVLSCFIALQEDCHGFFCNWTIAVRRWASGIRDDGPEAQNCRKGNYIEETRWLSSPLSVRYLIGARRRFPFSSGTVERVPVCFLAESVFPQQVPGLNHYPLQFLLRQVIGSILAGLAAHSAAMVS